MELVTFSWTTISINLLPYYLSRRFSTHIWILLHILCVLCTYVYNNECRDSLHFQLDIYVSWLTANMSPPPSLPIDVLLERRCKAQFDRNRQFLSWRGCSFEVRGILRMRAISHMFAVIVVVSDTWGMVVFTTNLVPSLSQIAIYFLKSIIGAPVFIIRICDGCTGVWRELWRLEGNAFSVLD